MIPALLFAFAAAGAPAARDIEWERPKAAYVARVLAVRDLPPPPPCPQGLVCTGGDPGNELDLDVETPLLGSPAPGSRKVRHPSHIGWPAFAQYEHVLVFEFERDGGKVISQTGFPVVMTTAGRWAFCLGQVDGDYVGPELDGLGNPVQFSAPLRYSSIDKEQLAPGAYSGMPAGARDCARGIFVEELVAIYADKLER